MTPPDPFESLDQALRELDLPSTVRAAAAALDLRTLRDLAATDPRVLEARFTLPASHIRHAAYYIRARTGRGWQEVFEALNHITAAPLEEERLISRWAELAGGLTDSLRASPLRAIPDLDVRAVNIARRLGVTTLGGLVALDAPTLLAERGFGPKTLAGTTAAITAYVADRASKDAGGPLDPFASLTALWRALAESLPAREHIVLDRRAALDGPVTTLDGVGTLLGLSRERIAQMERSALAQMTRDDRWVTALDERLRRALEDGPRAATAIAEEDPWLAALRDVPAFARYVFRRILGGRYTLRVHDGVATVARTVRPDLAERS